MRHRLRLVSSAILTGGNHAPVVLCCVLVNTPEPMVRRLRVPGDFRRTSAPSDNNFSAANHVRLRRVGGDRKTEAGHAITESHAQALIADVAGETSGNRRRRRLSQAARVHGERGRDAPA